MDNFDLAQKAKKQLTRNPKFKKSEIGLARLEDEFVLIANFPNKPKEHIPDEYLGFTIIQNYPN